MRPQHYYYKSILSEGGLAVACLPKLKSRTMGVGCLGSGVTVEKQLKITLTDYTIIELTLCSRNVI